MASFAVGCELMNLSLSHNSHEYCLFFVIIKVIFYLLYPKDYNFLLSTGISMK